MSLVNQTVVAGKVRKIRRETVMVNMDNTNVADYSDGYIFSQNF